MQKKVQVIFEAVLSNFSKNVKEAAKATLEIGEAGKKASKDIDFKNATQSSDKLKSSVKETSKSLDEVSDKGKKASNDINLEKPLKTSERFIKALKDLANNYKDVSNEAKKANKDANPTEAIEGIDRLNKRLDEAQEKLKKLAGLYVAKKVAGFATGLIKSDMEYYKELETGMRQVYTLLPDMSETAFSHMREDLKDFVVDMRTMPEEAIPALYEAISAGVSEDSVFDFLTEAKKASVGGRTDLTTSVDVLTSVTNAYGEILKVNEASDLMFMSVMKGKTSFEEMASNLYSVVPIAQNAGVSFDNITAAISTMTAKGTPTAQATTQIARSIEELSKHNTRASNTFKEMTGKTFREFMKEGHNIQEVYQIMEMGAKHLGMEVNDLMGSAEAGNAIITLTGEGAKKFTEDLEAMGNSAGATQQAYEKMTGTLSYAIDGVRTKIAKFRMDIQDSYSEEVKNSMEDLNTTFERLESDGTLERLAASIGGIASAIINQFDKILSHADTFISIIDTIAYHIENNAGTIMTTIRNIVLAFAGFKALSGVVGVIMTIVNVIQILGRVIPYVIAAAKMLWGVLAANPIVLIIGAVIALIGWLIHLAGGFEGLGNLGALALEGLKMSFFLFAKAGVYVLTILIESIATFISWIPGVGEAIDSASVIARNALTGLDVAISNTADNIHALRIEGAKGIKIPIDIGTDVISDAIEAKYEGVGNRASNGNRQASRDNQRNRNGGTTVAKIQEEINKLKMPKQSSSGGGGYKAPKIGGGGYKTPKNLGSGSLTKQKETISDKITKTKDKRQTQIDMFDSRAELARARKDRKAEKQNLNHMLYEMNRQAKDLLTLQNKSKGADKQKVETERNKLLAQIAETTEEIRKSYIQETIDKLKDGFQTAIDLHTSRAEVAQVNENDKSYRQHLNDALWEMGQQSKSLLELQNKSEGKDKSIVEIARNKLLVEIAKTTEEMKNGIAKMVGEFNIPSELRKFTEYQYKVQTSQGVLTKQLVVSPDIRMYLTVEDTDGKGVDKIKQEIKGFTNAIFQKDDLVSLFTRDVTRN